MTLHFIHIGKTGGTAVKRALRRARCAYWREEDAPNVLETPYGRIQLHHHGFGMRDVPAEDYAFFCLRDPIPRFLSAYYSRLNKGRPGHYREWTDAERRVFEAFPTPQRLAEALAGTDGDERSLARYALRTIRHMRPMTRSVGGPLQLRYRLGQVVYVARQETLDTDWEQLRSILLLPPAARLPKKPERAHRRDPSLDTSVGPDAVAALRRWYRRDYLLLMYCDALRAWKAWGTGPSPDGMRRLRYELRRVRGLPAVVPPPPAWLYRRLRAR